MMDSVLDQLRHSTPYYILGTNIHKTEFDERWAKLPPDAQEKISGACSRIQLVDAIQHEARFTDPWEQQQSEALQVYLMCTCFDALAGQDYKHFHDWVHAEDQNELVNKELNAIVETSQLQWYRKVTHQLATIWLKIYGVTKNYRELFDQLPDVLQQELIQSYAVIKEQKENLHDWNALSEAKRLDRIVKYLYQLRRNTFTHQAKISPTVHPEQGVSGVVRFIPQGFWDYSVYFMNLTDTRGEVSLLRIIAVGKMREMLDIPIDQGFLDLHWKIERYKQQFRQVYAELLYNERLSFIYFRDSMPDLVEQPRRGMWRFKNDVTRRLQQNQEINLAWFGADDTQIRNALSEYIEIIAQTNLAVSQFEIEARNPLISIDRRTRVYEQIREELSGSSFHILLVQLATTVNAMLNIAPQVVVE